MPDARLNEPYFLSGPPQPDLTVLPVTLDNRSFLVDTSRSANVATSFRRSSVQLLNSQQNIDKGESALTTPEVWRRTYTSWHHGMGQKFGDREDSDEFRYDTSKGINPWEKWEFSLLHDTAQLDATQTHSGVQAKGHTVALHADRASLYITDGTLELVDFNLGSSGCFIATDGYYVYVWDSTTKNLRTFEVMNNGSQITVTQVKSTGLDFGAGVTLSMFKMINFKLIAVTTVGKVYDVTNFINGTAPTLSTPVYAPPIPQSTFIDGCAGNQELFLLESCGCASYIHAFTIARNDSEGAIDTLLYSGVAAQLPDGEAGHCLYNYLGYIAIGTSKGFRFSAVGQGSITYGPLIKTPGPVTAFEGQDRFLYYSLTNFEGDTGLGRADLSEFVTDLQPAYASDLMCGTGGGEVTFINVLNNGKVVFGVSTSGVWKETDTYVDQGHITLSGWTFNVVDPKIGMYVTSQTSVQSGGTGSLYAKYNTVEEEVFLGDYQRPNQKFSLGGTPFHSVALHADIRPSLDKLATPKIFSAELRCTYVRGKASEWQVPLILSDEIELDNGASMGRNVQEDYGHLLSLVETGKQFLYIEDGVEWTVYATDFIWLPHERSRSSGWQGVFVIFFREVR